MTSYSTEEFLTVAEVAERLRLNHQTVRNWIDDGKLPAFRIGRRVRIARSDFDRVVNGGYSRAAITPSEDATVARAFWDGSEESVGDISEPHG
jgi:excisionase family DNA binding protein